MPVRGQFFTFEGIIALMIILWLSLILFAPIELVRPPGKIELSFYTMSLLDALENSKLLKHYILTHDSSEIQRVLDNTYLGYCARFTLYNLDLREVDQFMKSGCTYRTPEYVIWRDVYSGYLIKVEVWQARE